MEQAIYIEDKKFELIKIQWDGKTGVYKNDNQYLRIGDTEKIKKDLDLHKKMEADGFPVAKLIAEGELNGQYYFSESSLGEQNFGKIFLEDTLQRGIIDDQTFDLLLNIVQRFGKAQLKTRTETKDFEDFADGIHLNILCDELSQYRDAIKDYFERIKSRFSEFPFVITHGDFNPHNLYPTGVIDLEDSFYGPFGYDLISAIVNIDYFPDSQEYEYFAHYRFTPEHKERYFALIDSISIEAGLPPLSEFKNDFEFCRAVWHLVRMHKWPKIQQWRYNLFVQKFMR